MVAIDLIDNPLLFSGSCTNGLGSRVDYRQMDVYDLNPAVLGQFDVVLFMGFFTT